MLTIASVKKDIETCVIAKPSIVGNTHNQQDHTASLKDSTRKQEPSQLNSRSNRYPPNELSTSSYADVEKKQHESSQSRQDDAKDFQRENLAKGGVNDKGKEQIGQSSQHPVMDQGAEIIKESCASRPTKLDSIETSQRLNPQHSKNSHLEITSRAKVPPQSRQRIFQPKYHSQQDQKRQQAKKVFVPADSIRVNDLVWLENPKQP